MELFKLFGTIAINKDEANAALEEIESKAQSFGNKASKVFADIKPKLDKAFETESVDNFGESLDDASDEAQDLSKKAKDLSSGMDKVEDALKDADKAADEFDNSLDDVADSADHAESRLSRALGKIGGAVAAAFAIDKIIDFGKEIVGVAGEVSAEVSAFEQVMGDYSDEASAKVEKIADATGMVDTRLTPYMTSMTAKFKGLGYDINDATDFASRGLNLAADAAAFWDKSLDDSMGHLNSFINGSYEGGEAIGLFANDTQMAAYAVKEGIVSEAKEWSALDEKRKQATRLEYAENMFKMSGATGQAAKEADQYANVQANLTEKWRQFKAQIGEPLLQNVVLPAMEKLSGLVDVASEKFEDLKKWVSENKTALQIAAGVAVGLGTAISILAVAMNAAAIKTAVLTTVTKVATAAQKVFNFVMSANPIGIVITLIAALVAAFIYLWNNCEGFRNFWIGLWEKIKEAAKAVADWFSETWQAVSDWFVNLWEGVKNAVSTAWEFIKNIVKLGLQFIVNLIVGYFNLITLPFRFIWENCKEYVFAAWNWIKDKAKELWEKIKENVIKPVKEAFEKVKEWFQKLRDKAVEIWGKIRDKARELWNKIKDNIITPIQNAFAKVREFFDKIKNAIREKIEWARDKVKTAADKIKSNIVTPISEAYTKVKEKFDNIKNAIKEKIEWARDKVEAAINKIKGFFDFDWSLPKLKLPHFSIKGKFSLNPPSVPKLSIDWYKKAYDQAAMFTNPTVIPTLNGYKGFGDGNGAEFVTGQENLANTVRTAVKEETNGTIERLETLISMLAEFMPEIIKNGKKPITIDKRSLTDGLISDIDSKLGEINRLRERGR